jgi:hypothetical protein
MWVTVVDADKFLFIFVLQLEFMKIIGTSLARQLIKYCSNMATVILRTHDHAGLNTWIQAVYISSLFGASKRYACSTAAILLLYALGSCRVEEKVYPNRIESQPQLTGTRFSLFPLLSTLLVWWLPDQGMHGFITAVYWQCREWILIGLRLADKRPYHGDSRMLPILCTMQMPNGMLELIHQW